MPKYKLMCVKCPFVCNASVCANTSDLAWAIGHVLALKPVIFYSLNSRYTHMCPRMLGYFCMLSSKEKVILTATEDIVIETQASNNIESSAFILQNSIL